MRKPRNGWYSAEPREPVYLDGPSDRAQLKASNPAHYARAMRIFAAANRLCDENPARLQHAGADLRGFYCGMLLRTSNPPKWEIRFRLDDTRYVALVTVSADRPKLVPARQEDR